MAFGKVEIIQNEYNGKFKMVVNYEINNIQHYNQLNGVI